MWPYNKRLDTPKSQTAADINATDAVVAALVNRAQARQPIPTDVAAIRACQQLWSRCGHAMRVEGELAEQLQPQLAWVMACLARDGNAYLRRTASGRLMPAVLADIRGGADPRSWTYRLQDAAPTESKTFVAPSRDVLHFRVGVEPLTPWRGRSPLGRLTGEAAAEFEQLLSDRRPEYAISYPDMSLDADDIRQLKAQLDRLQQDRLPVTLGDGAAVMPLPKITETVTAARSDVAAHVAASFGLGAGFFSQSTTGTSMREAFREFLNHTLQPIASMIGMEATSKTGIATEIDISRLRLVDLVAAAKSFAAFREAGMPEDEALERAGLAND